jgi:serine/threonine protein kinase
MNAFESPFLTGQPVMRRDTLDEDMSLSAGLDAVHMKDIDDNVLDVEKESSSRDPRKRISLKDFTLIKVLGKGSFGKVLLVRKTDSGAIFAVKVLQKDHVVKRNQVEHTKTERRVLGYVKHPYIVRLHFAFQSKKRLYLVMNYCPGGELFFHLGRAGRFSEGRARFYAAEIMLALEYLHSLGVVYRDLKPENVLLDAEGHVMITDFGLSKEGINDNASAKSFCGTPEYLAPEVLTRTGHGWAADWWSLGALLYEMLTGLPPFYSRSRDRLFRKILHSTIKMPKFFSPDATDLVMSLLCRDPLKRLGGGGCNEIKAHPWFRGMEWALLEQRGVTPPFKPQIDNLLDCSNFDQEFTNLPINSVQSDLGTLSLGGSNSLATEENKFQDFTFVEDTADALIARDSITYV